MFMAVSFSRAGGPSQASFPELCCPQDIPGLQNQDTNLEQPFLSIYKRARRRVPVKDLGKVVYYAKVRLRFLHSQVRPRSRSAWLRRTQGQLSQVGPRSAWLQGPRVSLAAGARVLPGVPLTLPPAPPPGRQ